MTLPTTSGDLWVAYCPDGCPLALWAVESTPKDIAALVCLEGTGRLPRGAKSLGYTVVLKPRRDARALWPAIWANREMCDHEYRDMITREVR